MKIQIKRGLKQDLPALAKGEFGLCLDTDELYIGGENGNIPLNDFYNKQEMDLKLQFLENQIPPIVLGVLGEPQSNGQLTRYTGAGSYPLNLVEITDGDFVYYKWDDTKWPFSEIVEIIDENDNVFIKIPKMYNKMVYSGEGVLNERYISNVKLAGFDLESCFIDPATGKELDYILVAKYNGANVAGKLISKSNQDVQVSTALVDSRTRAVANGAGNHLLDYSIKFMLETLYLITFANHQSDTMFPQGAEGTLQKTGALDAMTHHTGYTKGLANYLMKFLGIENYISNVYTQVDGVKIVDHEVFVSDDYRNYNSLTTGTEGYTKIATTPSEDGYITALGNKGVPKTRTASSGTFYKNYLYQAAGYRTLYFGRTWAVYSVDGLFTWLGNSTLGTTISNHGVRLVKKPTT